MKSISIQQMINVLDELNHEIASEIPYDTPYYEFRHSFSETTIDFCGNTIWDSTNHMAFETQEDLQEYCLSMAKDLSCKMSKSVDIIKKVVKEYDSFKSN